MPILSQIDITGKVTIQVGPIGKSPTNKLTFPANPDLSQDTDVRVTVYQTESGIYTDDYGVGIQKITLTGTTAWSSPQGLFNGALVNGYLAAQHLYMDILEYYFQQEQGNSNPQTMEMTICDNTSGGVWQVKPISPGMSLTRTSSDPLCYHFTATFIVLLDLTTGTATTTSDSVMSAVTSSLGPGLAPPSVAAGVQVAPNYSNTPAPVQAAVSATQAVTQTPPKTYKVVSGDTLWSIATTQYKNGSLYTLILSANPIITNKNLIFPNQILIIPPGLASNPPTTTTTSTTISQGLPNPTTISIGGSGVQGGLSSMQGYHP